MKTQKGDTIQPSFGWVLEDQEHLLVEEVIECCYEKEWQLNRS